MSKKIKVEAGDIPVLTKGSGTIEIEIGVLGAEITQRNLVIHNTEGDIIYLPFLTKKERGAK